MNIDSKQQSLLTFRVGPVLCCAPSLPVRSIIKPPKFTQPPGSDSSQPGIFKHGSHIVKILNLRHKFGIEQAEQTQPGNLIITIFEKESFAFWVDQILDVFDFPSEGWGNLPAAIPRGVFSRTLLLNKKIHLYCEFEKLARIKDLGYLKHYILQLTQQSSGKPAEKEKTISKTRDNKSTLDKASQTTLDKRTHDTTSNIEKTKETKEKQNKVITQPASQYENTKQETTKTSAQLTQPTQTSEIKVEKQIIKKAPVTQAIKEKSKPSPIKPAIQKPPIQEISKKESPIIPIHEIKTHSHNENKKTEEKQFSTQTSSSYSVDETETSNTHIIILFIFILASLAAGIYYLYPEDISNDSKYKKKNIISQTESNFSTEIIRNENTEINETEKELEILKPEQMDSIDKPTNEQDPKSSLDTIENKKIEHTQYRADISQLNKEITITIHQPVDAVKKQEEAIITPQKFEEENKIETILTTPAIKPLKQNELNKTVPPEKIINEVIHIIVKGDTLWSIAKKYVNDPFLYPELARLSNIKNPHRIYPGNRVRIRFIKN